MTNAPPPGWYDDPHHPDGQRWWDGERWTEHAQGGSSQPRPPTGQTSAETSQAQSNTSNGFSIAAMALGAIALLFFPIVFGLVAIVMAAIAMTRDENWSIAALIIAVATTVIGMVLGAIVGMTLWG